MTSPIKPPSRPPVMPLESLEHAASKGVGASVEGAESGSEFKASLDALRPADGVASEGVAGTEATSPQALGAALRANTISPAQALDALVAQALDSADAQLLEPAARAELERHLRTMLADDPSLRELASDLSRT